MLELVPTEQPASPVRPALQRAIGKVEAHFSRRDDGTYLADLHQAGSAKLRLPRRRDGIAEAILINTAGGLAGGDQLSVGVDADPGTRVIITTQASERAYRSVAGPARVDTHIEVGAGARLDWLPQETILFDQARLSRRFSVDLDENAVFLAVESAVLGRAAMGETVRSGSYHDRWRIRRSGELIHADDIRFEGDIDAIAANSATLGGAIAMATIIYCGSDGEQLIDTVRDAVGDTGGASLVDGKLLARVVAEDNFALRQKLMPAIAALRDGADLPKPWRQ